MESPSAILARYGLRAKKSWGQCFLHDRGVVRRIVDLASVVPDDTVVEIGAGLGILTEALAPVAGRVLAIERDRDLARVLRERLADRPNVTVVEQNALRYDFSGFDGPVVVVGNLPYNIASPLVFHLLEARAGIRSATLMLQRELAERIVAAPGSRVYGAPSVLCQQAAEVRLGFTVAAGAFVPKPRVDSAVLRFVFRPTPRAPVDGSADLFRRVVRAAFSTRRKTLRNALGGSFPPELVAAALERVGLDGNRRGETLSVEEFAQLSAALHALGAG